MNPMEERERLIFKALSTLMETPSISIPHFSEKLGIDKERLYSIFEILDSENYARNLKFARGGLGNKIQVAWYNTAIITDKGIGFMKEYRKAHSNTKMEEPLHFCNTPTVFISYNWSNNAFVDEIEASLAGKAEVHRDKGGIKPWGSITDFMKSIRQQDFAVLVISDAYLKSSACLYEVVQLMKDDGWNDKTMYVVLDDARSIYAALSQADYIKYWNEKCEDLKQKITGLPPATTAKLSEELNKSYTILLSIGGFMSMVSDANNPPLDKVIAEIQKRIMANMVLPAADDTVPPPLPTGTRRTVSLSKEAIALLLSACEDKHGVILKVRTLSGLSVDANGRNFVSSQERREEARWEAAVDELQKHCLIRATNYKNDVFEIIRSGFDTADQLKAQLGDRHCDCPRCKYSGPSKYDNVCPICGFTSDDD